MKVSDILEFSETVFSEEKIKKSIEYGEKSSRGTRKWVYDLKSIYENPRGFIDEVLSSDMLDGKHERGEYEFEISRYITDEIERILSCEKEDNDFYKTVYNFDRLNISEIKEGKDIRSEVAVDCIRPVMMSLLSNEWVKSKQIYSFNEYLAEKLIGSDVINIPANIFDRLPFRTIALYKNGGEIFYITRVERFDDLEYLIFLIIFYDRSKETWECGTEIISLSVNEDSIYYVQDNWEGQGNHFSFVLNALLYLCANNADVEESEITKKTYRPSKTIRNKFSEIRQWDCGYHYGPRVGSKRDDAIDGVIDENKSRRSPRPHMRRAHWHHYWTGSDDKELVLKWIDETFIMGVDNNITIRDTL